MTTAVAAAAKTQAGEAGETREAPPAETVAPRRPAAAARGNGRGNGQGNGHLPSSSGGDGANKHALSGDALAGGAGSSPATDSSAPPWLDENQRQIDAALDAIRHALEQQAARVAQEQGPQDAAAGTGEDAALPAATGQVLDAPREVAAAPSPALALVCQGFRLSPFERDVLLLCAGVELDARFAALCAAAHGDSARPYPTFGLALAALPGAHWSALTPGGPLRKWRLIEINVGANTSAAVVAGSPLRIDERVLHFLAGVNQMDERLIGLIEPLAPHAGALVPSHRAVAEQIVSTWNQAPRQAPPPPIQLCGGDLAGKRAVAQAACAAIGLHVSALAADALPASAADLEPMLRLWERESVFSSSALLLDCDHLSPGEAGDQAARGAAISRLVEHANGVLLISSRERQQTHGRPLVTFDVKKPSTPEQRDLWCLAVGASPNSDLAGEVGYLAAQFDVNAQTIRAATLEARGRLALPDSDAEVDDGPAQAEEALAAAPTRLSPVGRALWDACRVQARPALDNLSQRIPSGARWEDLVLPEGQRHILRDIAAHVRQRTRVYEEWGFGGRGGGRSLGLSALFAGVSGTGKTTAAEVLGRELRLDVYRIDLSSVVSKYIGETEKNLGRVFDAAEEGGAILLFDEADALFGKRSEVKDSHDRYANIEVSYLLQRMETYRGLAVLTTNLKSSIDQAFLRRIRFVIQFPFPDAATRAEIWRRVFPKTTPTDGLLPERLGQLNVSGGNIKNIALNAAFVAADAGEPVMMKHVLRAARAEYAKLEKTLTDAEIAGWV